MTSPAELYQNVLVPAVFGPWADELLRRAAPPPGARVLDVGCGTGVVTRAAARIVGPRGAVTGLDMNPAMLEVARHIPVEEGSGHITWVQSAADQIALPDATFDLITCQQVLQFVPDRGAVLREFRRLLAPGGRVAIAAWAAADLHPFQQGVDVAIARHTGQPALVAGFALSDPDEIRQLLEDAGFQVIAIDYLAKESRFPDPEQGLRGHLLAATAGIPSFRQLDAGSRTELIDQIVSDLSDLIRANTVAGELVHAWHSHIAIATVPNP
jgi:ubiquinone/menaquinone biosynthesis C-methylase UbiE